MNKKIKNLIILILCVVCGVMATSSDIKDTKDIAFDQFTDSLEEARSQYEKCEQSAANQSDCLATYCNTYKKSVNELKSVLTSEEIDEINEELPKIKKETFFESLEKAGCDLCF